MRRFLIFFPRTIFRIFQQYANQFDVSFIVFRLSGRPLKIEDLNPWSTNLRKRILSRDESPTRTSFSGVSARLREEGA